MFSLIISVLALVVGVTAKTISIAVGENGALAFNPNTTTADTGDMLEFHFYNGSGPHSVVMGMYDQPCVPAANAFFSDYITGSSTSDETYIVPINTTSPIWYYCSAHKHCQNGMVGVINPPSNATVSEYAAAAKSVSSNVAPASTMVGGIVTTMPASIMTATASMTGTHPNATNTGLSSSAKSSSVSAVSTAGGARQTAGVMGLMAAGGLAALMV